MRETSKSIPRRLTDSRFARRYLAGDGIDVGCGDDPLSLYAEFFPLMRSIRLWDLPDGDAQTLPGVAADSFDFVHSSHCLEHMLDPKAALARWFEVLRPGGHLVILVPDEDLYEMGFFPSKLNEDHKWTFTLHKDQSWSPRSLNVMDLIGGLGAAAQPVRLELLDSAHRYGLPALDQTLTPVGECAIEAVIRKRPQAEIDAKGRLPPPGGVSYADYYALTGIRLTPPE